MKKQKQSELTSEEIMEIVKRVSDKWILMSTIGREGGFPHGVFENKVHSARCGRMGYPCKFFPKDIDSLLRAFTSIKAEIFHLSTYIPSEHNEACAEMLNEVLGKLTRIIPLRVFLEGLGINDDQWQVRKSLKRQIHFSAEQLSDIRNICENARFVLVDAIDALKRNDYVVDVIADE